MKTYLLILVVSFITFSSVAQKAEFGRWDGVLSTSGGGFNLTKGNFNTMFISIAPGYRCNEHFSIRAVGEVQVGLFPAHLYKTQVTLGMNVGYRIIPAVELNASIGSTIVNEDKWNFVYYDVNGRWFLSERTPNFFIGAGLRYQQMYHRQYRDRLPIYASFGWRFNSAK